MFLVDFGGVQVGLQRNVKVHLISALPTPQQKDCAVDIPAQYRPSATRLPGMCAHACDVAPQAAASGASGIGTTVVGTYGYMAPEQFRGAASPASDLYGLGGTLLFLLSGACTGVPCYVCNLQQVRLRDTISKLTQQFAERHRQHEISMG